jgi:hypothetical protein
MKTILGGRSAHIAEFASETTRQANIIRIMGAPVSRVNLILQQLRHRPAQRVADLHVGFGVAAIVITRAVGRRLGYSPLPRFLSFRARLRPPTSAARA